MLYVSTICLNSTILHMKENHINSFTRNERPPAHYSDVIMGTTASQITRLTIVYSTIYSGADQRKHQGSASLAFVQGIHRSPVNSPHKGPVTRKMFPFHYVIVNGLRSFSYLGSNLWNDLVNLDPAIAKIGFNELIEFLKDWGPNTNDGFSYEWHVSRIFVILHTILHLCLILSYFLVSNILVYIFLLHCKYFVPSCILAFWLMLPVSNTNKAYLNFLSYLRK